MRMAQKMNKYWAERQEELTTRSIKKTEKQIQKYYLNCYKNLLGQFESTYNAVFSQMSEGKDITPAHLYNLDKYWKLQAELKAELEKLMTFAAPPTKASKTHRRRHRM